MNNIKPEHSRASAVGGGPVSEHAAADSQSGKSAEACFQPGENALALFCPSETMRLELANLLKYCALAGIDADGILSEMKKEGLLPAPDRRGGKKALVEFRNKILAAVRLD